MNKEDMLGLRVAANPQQVIPKPKGLGGRRGTIIGFDESAHGWPIVEFDLEGRERKKKRRSLPINFFVELTERNEKAIAAWEASQ